MEARDYFDRLASRQMPIVLDEDSAAAQVAALGFPVERFEDHDFSAPDAPPSLLVITQEASIGRLHALWSSAQSSFGYLALAKLDGSPRALDAAFTRLLATDHHAALTRRDETYDRMLSCKDLEITTAGGVLRCHMNDELEIANNGSALEPGMLYSVAEFFEASVVNLEDERSSFWVEGELAFDGFIHLCNSGALKAQLGPALDDLQRRAASGSNLLRFTDNAVDRVVIGGADVTGPCLAMLEGKERGAAVTELGLGCADVSGAEDWSLNMVLHKTGLGAYVGIGRGLDIPHVDFIARGASIRFTSPA